MTPDRHGPASATGAPPGRRGLGAELRRKSIHLAFLIVPLGLLHSWLPWPRSRGEWTVFLVLLVSIAVAIDLARIHERRFRVFFAQFFGELVRRHEATQLLGSTYLLIATLLAVDLFSRPVAAAAVGFTVLGDGFAAIVGRAFGRTRFFGKSLEGALGGLIACLAWAAYVASFHHLPWSIAMAGALAASLAEFLPIPLDDNLSMTLISGYTMRLLGAPP